MAESKHILSELLPVIKNRSATVYNEAAVINHLLLDSRKLLFPEQSMFFAIKGNKLDGHHYIPELYEKGVRNFVVEQEIDLSAFKDANVILVDSSVTALQQVAAYHRNRFSYPVIGITGSNGKTIVKEWLYQLLSDDKHIVRSPKSFNSQIGVPLSVWLMEDDHDLGIFEAGISEPEEMQHLEPIIKPDIGILSNIGEAHSEGFVSKVHKTKEKLKLFANADVLIYCKDYPEINQSVAEIKANLGYDEDNIEKLSTFTWSMQGEADVRITQLKHHDNHTKFSVQSEKNKASFEIPFSDRASVENIIHCIVLMMHLEYTSELIQDRILQLSSIAMRLELKDAVNYCSIINDSYNSDLGSLEIAIDFLKQQVQHDKRTVILSDILQSGKNPLNLYSEVADLMKRNKIHKFIGIGEEVMRQKSQFESIKDMQADFYSTTNDFLDEVHIEDFNQEAILIKGARPFRFDKISKLLEVKVHETVLEVNLGAIKHNLKAYQSLLKPGVGTMAMVKAFAYGSGSHEIASVLQFNRVDYLGVAYVDEGISLRNAGITLPIMVMNPDSSSFDSMVKYRLEPEIYSLSQFDRFIKTLRVYAEDQMTNRFPIHIMLDTGMHRLGFEEEDIEKLIEVLQSTDLVKVQSIFSHLAASDEAKHDAFTAKQCKRFTNMSDQIIQNLHYPILRHIANTSAIVRFPEAQFDMVRLGIGLYGVDVSGKMAKQLVNVSQLKTTISQVKNVKKGDTVGYSRSGKATRDMRIATVGIGYADGYNRKLGNGNGYMMVHGKEAPTVGNICMDMCMLDITDIPLAKAGDKVVVFGEELPLSLLAKQVGTIPYEMLTGISSRVKRVYFQE